MLVVFEGIDGCGKTTQSKLLLDYLTECGRDAKLFREPGGVSSSEAIRSIILDKKYDVAPISELLLFYASRRELIEKKIIPALESGCDVILDRFYASTLAYQGYGRGIDIGSIQMLNTITVGDIAPDYTILLDVSPEVGFSRMEREYDRMESSGDEFYNRVREGYLKIAERSPDFYLLNAECDPIELHEEVVNIVNL